MSEKKRIGILGGTFNPIHLGHLILAERAYDEFDLDKVLIIPTGISHFKLNDNVLGKDMRLEMTKLAIEDNDHFELSTIEVDRPGNSYTYETLELLKSSNPENEYFLIVGADSLFKMETWMKPEVIFADATILAAVRDNEGISELEEKAEFLKQKFGAKICILHSPLIDISSTEIRERVKAGKSVKYLVTPKVASYIYSNNLYSQSTDEAK